MTKKVVLITGATAGIGRAAALAFARGGARLVCAGRDATAGAALLAELREQGAGAEFVVADVSNEEQVSQLVDRAVARFGQLDVAVNSAGIEGTPGSITAQTVDSFAATFDANVLGTFLCMKHELRVMLENQRGAVVNLSSTMGSRGNARNAIYVASKHAAQSTPKCSNASQAAPTSSRQSRRASRPAASARPKRSPTRLSF